jgi:tripartite-type tricarboxylate transporter receptor subunit TctC
LSIAAIAGIRELDPSRFGGRSELTRRLNGALRHQPDHGSTMEGLPARAALLHSGRGRGPGQRGKSMMTKRMIILATAAFALATTAASHATAQVYPSRPVTIIVPFSAGGTTDVIARILGEHMSRTLGQQFIVENVVGAGGTTGSIRAMRASPDGYTIELGNMGTHAAAVALYPNLAYHPEVDFAPVGMVAGLPVVIVGKKGLPPNDLKEFAAYVKANAETLNMAHAGVGSITHFTCLLLNSVLGVKPTMVPFNGAAPAITALIGGQVDYMCNVTPDVVQHIRGGAFKAYAIGSSNRNAALPDVPTSKEAGLPQFQASAWNALFAPKGTPRPILDKLSDALQKAIDDETTRKRLLDLGSEIPDKTRRGQQALAALLKDEIARWTPIIKAAAVKSE